MACEAALHQQNENSKWKPSAFFSHTLTETERNYAIYNRELLAIILVLRKWRPYLLQQQGFDLFTDHLNLTYFRQPQQLNRQQARWLGRYETYDRSVDSCLFHCSSFIV